MRRELGAARDALHAAREECASGECGVPASGVLPHLLCEYTSIWAVAFYWSYWSFNEQSASATPVVDCVSSRE